MSDIPKGTIHVPPPVLNPKDTHEAGFMAVVDNNILCGDWTVKPKDAKDIPNTRLLMLSLQRGDQAMTDGFTIWLKETDDGLVPLTHATGTVSEW